MISLPYKEFIKYKKKDSGPSYGDLHLSDIDFRNRLWVPKDLMKEVNEWAERDAKYYLADLRRYHLAQAMLPEMEALAKNEKDARGKQILEELIAELRGVKMPPPLDQIPS